MSELACEPVLVEQEVPASIALASTTVAKDDVAQYLPLGFES